MEEFKMYKYKYYLNFKRSLNNTKEYARLHTFTMTLYIEALNQNEFNEFMVVDEMITPFIQKYKGRYINEIPPFDQQNPTIENVGDAFYEQLKILLQSNDFDLAQLEISETPVRIYVISDRLFDIEERRLHYV